MLKCPVCEHNNEDGALFCEQCKSDLNQAAPTMQAAAAEAMSLAAAAEAVPAAIPVAAASPETLPLAEPVTVPPAAVPVAEMASEEPSAVETMFSRAPAAPSASSEAPPPGTAVPPGAQPKLVVLRGLKNNLEYPLYEGHNFIGRADEKPVDIDLEDQEPPDRIWSSRQHALITFEDSQLYIEDLNSSNGTFVNRGKVYPGQRRPISVGDVIQIGTVQMKVKV
jgi:hypothetical protein